jgi:cell division inhibitor SulA/protein ImuA
MSQEDLERLLRSQHAIWRGYRAQDKNWSVLSTGFAELDAALSGGWPLGAVLEICTARLGIGELPLLLPAMAEISNNGRWIAWITPPHQPYAPALRQAGVDLAYLLVVNAREAADIPWSMEKLLRSGECGMALAWPQRLADHQIRRLQLAAEQGNALAVLFPRQMGSAGYAALRLVLKPVDEGVMLQIVKARGSLHCASLILRG